MKRTDFIETLSQEEMQTVKGGIWVYDKTTDTWKWIEKYSLDPDEEEQLSHQDKTSSVGRMRRIEKETLRLLKDDGLSLRRNFHACKITCQELMCKL